MAAQPHMAVICVTCGSRLKVLDRRLIGGIANCPKCGAMVEITADAIRSAGPGPQRPATQPRSSPQRGDQPHLAVGQATGIDSEALTQSAVASPGELDAVGLSGPADDGDEPGHGEAAEQSLSGTSPLPADPGGLWQSASSRRVSQLGLVVTLGLFGLIAATIAFAQFARSWSRWAQQESVVQAGQNPPVIEHDPATAPQVASATPAAAGDPLLAAADPAADPHAGELRAGPVADPPPAVGGDGPVSDGPVGDDVLGDALAASSNERMTVDAAAGASDRAALLDPLAVPSADALSPADADGLLPAASAAPAAGAAELPAGLEDLPPELRKFIPLLNQSTAENGAPQIFETPPTIDSVRLDAAAGEEWDQEQTAKRPAVDIPRALALRLAIDHGGVTLAELMLLVSQLTGAAVEVELISLDLAGISAAESLKTPAGWMSVQQWLDQSLAPAGMVAEILDDRVLVHATAEKIAQASGAALRLDDFGDSAAEVARWVRPVVGPLQAVPAADLANDDGDGQAADGAAALLAGDAEAELAGDAEAELADDAEDPWRFIADEKRVAVPQDRAALIRTLLVLESARMIRELPPRLPRWQTARWIGRWSSAAGDRQPPAPAGQEQAAASDRSPTADAISDWPIVTDGVSGPRLDSPRTTAGLLRQLATENRVAIIVAWRDALRHQFYPTDLAMPFNNELSAGAFIDELVGEFALQARDAGGSVWWIGSEANYDRYEVICWLTIPAGTGEQVARQLAEALGVDDPAALPVAWDENTVLVRAPRFIARQLSRFIRS